jgi:hypothetical protein
VKCVAVSPLNCSLSIGDVRGYWGSSVGLDAIFGDPDWKYKASPTQYDAHRPTTSFVLFGPYREAITMMKADGSKTYRYVIKEHGFQFVIRRKPLSCSENDDTVECTFKLDRR